MIMQLWLFTAPALCQNFLWGILFVENLKVQLLQGRKALRRLCWQCAVQHQVGEAAINLPPAIGNPLYSVSYASKSVLELLSAAQ